ncbi:hypothetical protein MNB_SV-15-148 [hydrothermal vent metagenome]|uniref:SH3b domain-containing protein n=1 Tax=hydrothermal vent metagenome TaxID=652676 RepID=A0A1W1EL43_9ZZZZ
MKKIILLMAIGSFAFGAFQSQCVYTDGVKEKCFSLYSTGDPIETLQLCKSILRKNGIRYKRVKAQDDLDCPTIDTLLNSLNKKYQVVNVRSNDTLSIRSNAGSGYKKIDALPYNAKNIKVIKCKNISKGRKWCKIKHHSIYDGWVNAKYIEVMY